MNIQQLFEDHNIETWTEGVNCQKGWLNIQCPMCDDRTNHGGINLKKLYYNCWRCGHHFLDNVISKVLGISQNEAKNLIKSYKNNVNYSKKEQKQVKNVKNLKQAILPIGTEKLKKIHRNYLESRNFDSYVLEKKWNLLGTNHLGDYKFRLIAPVYFENKIVSFQGRDVSSKSDLRYKNCKPENEIMPLKECVYGIEKIKNNSAIIVEGIFDVWRLGFGAISLFGVNYTKEQLLILSESLKKVFVLFDLDNRAVIKQAEDLSFELSGLGVESEFIELKNYKDTAKMPQSEADLLKLELLGY